MPMWPARRTISAARGHGAEVERLCTPQLAHSPRLPRH